MSQNKLPPVIGITLGDPAGVGPEIVVKLLGHPDVQREHRAIVLGDLGILERTLQQLGSSLQIHSIQSPAEAQFLPGSMDVVPVTQLPDDLPIGQVSATAGQAAFAYLERGIQLALEGQIAAICTAPLNKEALHLAGFNYPGHTEILADLSHTQDFGMMLVNPELRVIFVSVHVSLLEAIRQVTPERELHTIKLAYAAMRQIGIGQPRIAVAGLNPHAGEGGMFGREELEAIAPAVLQAQSEGINAMGPYPPDTVFMRARRGEFDIVVCQYHDQGHIPIKYMGLEEGVNVTVGLPFIRTSVDHGTAFDIAGTGKASERSLRVALDMARDLSWGAPKSR